MLTTPPAVNPKFQLQNYFNYCLDEEDLMKVINIIANESLGVKKKC
jgi:hypothetical protein